MDLPTEDNDRDPCPLCQSEKEITLQKHMGNLNIEKTFILIKKNVHRKVAPHDFDDSSTS